MSAIEVIASSPPLSGRRPRGSLRQFGRPAGRFNAVAHPAVGTPIPLPATMAPCGKTGLAANFRLLELGKPKVADMEALDLGPCDKNELHYDPKRKETFDVKSLSNSCSTDWTE